MLRSCKIVLILSLIARLYSADTAFAQTNHYSRELFPLPEVLKPNVEFWKNVYARYSEREVIIHDSWDLGIVYEVVHLDSLFRGANVSARIEWKKIEEIKKKYKAILLRLSRRRKIDLASLRGKEKRVAALFGPKVRAKALRTAAHRIRGQTGLKERFQTGLIRSGLYLHQMRQIFQEEGLPLELLVLPHVESSFNYRAYSKLGAAGLWQFTRSTGRRFMTINYNVDQRLDPIVATRAAARLLKQNYAALGAWPLAITAYNHGRNGMVRAKRKFGTDIGKIAKYYRSRSFGFASRNFYAEFLAALHVATNYKKYFGSLKFYQPKEYVEYRIPDYITVKALVKKLGLDAETFAEYNPALRSPVLKSRRRIPKNFTIRLPSEAGVDMATRYAQISPEFKHDRQVTPEWHKVRPGENLTQIARRYRVPLSDLMAANNIRNAHRIYAGQNLQIPFGRRVASMREVPRKTAPRETQLVEADLKKEEKTSLMDVPPTIQLETLEKTQTAAVKGSSLNENGQVSYLPSKRGTKQPHTPAQSGELSMVLVAEMASRSESVEEIMEMALPDHYVELTRDMDIRVVVAPKAETIHESFRTIDMPLNGQVVVEPDETLGHFADWLGVPTHRLRRINRMSYGTPIRIGQPLWLTFEKVTPEEFHRRRVEYHQGIEEDFYRNFTVEGEAVYKVKPGDNIWLICNRNFEMPHWLLKKHNADRDLSNLVAGEEIIIPIVEARFPEDVLNN